MGSSELVNGAMLIARLGLAVYEAWERGEHTKTVREIFDGVPRDADTIARLREVARQHYAQRDVTPPKLAPEHLDGLRRLLGARVLQLTDEERAALEAAVRAGGGEP